MTERLITQSLIIGGCVSLFWLLEVADQLIFQKLWLYGLDTFGISPRRLVGLIGIGVAPFLHGGWQHLIANTIPFMVLGWLTMVQKTSDFFLVTIATMGIGGLGIWLFGETDSIHIGASVLIFGYLGFMLLRGYFQQNFISIFLSILVVFLYGKLLFGLLPAQRGISWEGHLFGFIGGVITAYQISHRYRHLD